MSINNRADLVRAKRTELCGGVPIVGMILFAILTISIEAQNTNPTPKLPPHDGDCIKVSLIADSNRLEKRNPILLRVKIENFCDRTIEILEPEFTIDKSIVNGKKRFGDSLVGRIIRTKTSKIDNTTKTIIAGKYQEFALATNELRWMDSMSSIEIFRDLYTDHDLKTGNYHLYCTVVVYPTTEEHNREKGGKVKWILSNKVEVLFEEEPR